jgi:hypothetical protein
MLILKKKIYILLYMNEVNSSSNYLSKIIFLSSFFYLILFCIFSYNYGYKYNVNFTQSFLTLFFSLMILSFLTYYSFDKKEFSYILFYFTYILAIPLIYHILFLLFFQNYDFKNSSYIKISLVFILMFYLTIVWFNVKHFINKDIKFTNNFNLCKNMFQILFTVQL